MPDLGKLRISICIPTRGALPWGFAYDLAQLYGYTVLQLVDPDRAELGLTFGENTYIHRNREDIAEHVLNDGATHLLWLDDDMRFPREALLHLLAHDVPFVGANYSTRGMPPEAVAIKQIGDTGEPSERLLPPSPASGLEPVDALGFGCALIRAEVFRAIERPWFENYRDRERNRWVGEDVDFCMKATRAGFRPQVDHDLSERIEHLGGFAYKLAHARVFREERNGARHIHQPQGGGS